MGWCFGKEALAASIALAYMARLCIIILGDLQLFVEHKARMIFFLQMTIFTNLLPATSVLIVNARTARAALLDNQLLHPACTSMDKGKVTAHGTWLCEVFKDYNLVFVSGAEIFGPSGTKFTRDPENSY
jgi:hypothetical protein